MTLEFFNVPKFAEIKPLSNCKIHVHFRYHAHEQLTPPLKKRKCSSLKWGIINTQARLCAISFPDFQNGRWLCMRGVLEIILNFVGFGNESCFFEVKFSKELTSFQGSSCSKYDNFQRWFFRWRLPSCQQKTMSLQKIGYLVKVS